MSVIANVIGGFKKGWQEEERKHFKKLEEDKKLRSNLKEHQIDKMLADSFPASDPPSTY